MRGSVLLARGTMTWLAAALITVLMPDPAKAGTNVLFNASQATNFVSAGTTSDTISTEGYLFTFTRDKLFTGGVGLTNPIGRFVKVSWPDGLEAQAVTAGPKTGAARFDIKRIDGQVFDLPAFTAKLLANTAGAGGAIEVMPIREGEDLLQDPVMCNATGFYGQVFAYNTPQLTNADTYKITLYVDFAIMSITLVDFSLPPPLLSIAPLSPGTVELSWPAEQVGYALESTTALQQNTWTPVTDPITENGATFSVQITTSTNARWFRLVK